MLAAPVDPDVGTNAAKGTHHDTGAFGENREGILVVTVSMPAHHYTTGQDRCRAPEAKKRADEQARDYAPLSPIHHDVTLYDHRDVVTMLGRGSGHILRTR
jgi:hypothetical protein